VNDEAQDPSAMKLEDRNYGSYLKLGELLSLQELKSKPLHHDEMFFIIIHQSFELWFKEILHETDLLARHLRKGRVSRTLKVIKRINSIMECLAGQIQLLGTLTPVEFAGFREELGTGSGLQSVQFRELEFAFGLRDPFFLKYFEKDTEARERVQARMQAPSIYDEFLRALAAEGVPIPTEVLDRDVAQPHELSQPLVQVLSHMYAQPEEEFHRVLLSEALLDFDTLFAKWRAIHVLAVSRTIGGRRGTGGSSGKAFLEARLGHRFFPELWEVRNLLIQEKEEGG